MIDWALIRLKRQLQHRDFSYEHSMSPLILRAILEREEIHPNRGSSLREEVFLSWAWTENGGILGKEYCVSLEKRSVEHIMLWPIAARIHAAQHEDRVTHARRVLSVQQLPFSLPQELDEIQVEVLACGDKILNALHVDWVRKVARHTLDALVLDCRHIGFWFRPILDVLPEELIKRNIKKIVRAKKLQKGSLGLAGYYARRLNMNEQIFLERGTKEDKEIFSLAMQGS